MGNEESSAGFDPEGGDSANTKNFSDGGGRRGRRKNNKNVDQNQKNSENSWKKKDSFDSGGNQGSNTGSNMSRLDGDDYLFGGSKNREATGGRRAKKKKTKSTFKKPEPLSADLDDDVGEIDLPLESTSRTIAETGRKIFKDAMTPKSEKKASQQSSSLGSGSKKSNNNNSPQEKSNFSSFDTLYYSESTSPKKSSRDDDDESDSNPFGISSNRSRKAEKTRSIDVDVKMGNAKLKAKVREDRQNKVRKKKKTTFHRPNNAMMYDDFDDLDEEVIGDGEIGNGSMSSRSSSPDFVKTHKKPMSSWGADNSIQTLQTIDEDFSDKSSNRRNRGDGEGWF